MRRTMRRTISRMLVLVLAAGASAQAAQAFDAFGGTGPGTHLGSAFDALAEAYGVESSRPAVIKTMPVYGVPSYAWPSFRAAELFCEATRDVDIFFFGPLYPHGQTPEFGYGRELSDSELARIEAAAVRDYLRHVAGTIEKARGLYRGGRPREATYLLGFLAHSYQDLWAHRGITNGMHRALLAHEGVDVDREAGRVAELRRRLPGWLRALPGLLGSEGTEFERYIRSGADVKPMELAERKRVLGRGRDIFAQGPAYVLFATKSAKALRYRERIEWDVETVDAMLLDRSALDSVLALGEDSDFGAFLRGRGYRF